jgi:hypothetical protein
MFQFISLLLVCFTVSGGVAAQSADFVFRPGRVAVGTVYHYSKTNVDGTQPENISLYIADPSHIESLKYHNKGERAGLVKAEMDWASFLPKKLESWQVLSQTEQKLFATLTFRPADRAVEVSIPAMRPEPEMAAIGRLPFHLYNFDLASLNVSFPHLADPKSSFTIGIADPTFKENGPMFAYRGELRVAYERDEVRNGVKCRRYSAAGAGIGGKGTIWVNKKLGHIEDMEFDVANNPDWQTFKLKLQRIEKMSGDGWRRFIESQF